MIKTLKLKNFTAFSDIEIEFSPKINIIIGENSTGKTHLLKAAYALSFGSHLFKENKDQIESILTKKFIDLFMPLDDKLGKIHKRGATNQAEVESSSFYSDLIKLKLAFHNNSKEIDFKENKKYEDFSGIPVFIPTKEVLSLIKGITSKDSDKKTIESLFDDTYLDLCKLLLQTNGSKIPEKIDYDPRFGTIYPKIVNAIGGKYYFSDGRFLFKLGKFTEKSKQIIREIDENDYEIEDPTENILHITSKTVFAPFKDSEISNCMTAEGFRKLGILQQLLTNKSLNPGTTGPLFWDEPESNMNPKLMRLLVEILLELSRNGQQIILATHDYIVLKWFDLLMDKGKEDHVRFHALYQDIDTKEIKIESCDNYLEINKNAIADTYTDLTKEQVKKQMGDLGK